MVSADTINADKYFHSKANWVTNVVTDERLITGQNPGSAGEVGEAIIKLLS